MDDGLVPESDGTEGDLDNLVLILVVVDDGLVHMSEEIQSNQDKTSLNPCCSGRWSRT